MREVETPAAFAISPIFISGPLDLKPGFKPNISSEPTSRIAVTFDTSSRDTLFSPLTLPNGQVIPNRLAKPRAMTETDIARVITQFAETAALAEAAGFDGVEVHAAHGYLLSQFLSPLTNRSDDHWGGSLENRARILIEILRAIRARVAPDFGLGVKLNSADFQKGGFDAADAVAVVRMLNTEGVDLVEISGGSYESPAMHGRPAHSSPHASSRAREIYFVDYAVFDVGFLMRNCGVSCCCGSIKR